MAKRIIFLIASLALIGSVCYLFYFNIEPVTLTLWAGEKITAPFALILVSTFAIGIVLASLIGFFVIAKKNFTISKLNKSLKSTVQSFETTYHAKERMAVGDYKKAISSLTKVVDKQPENLEARITLAKAFKEIGELKESRKVLDDSRANQKQNVELLMNAANLNIELSSFTSAYDNLQLIKKEEPNNTEVIKKMVLCCKELRRFDEAIDLQKQLLRHSDKALHESLYQELAALELSQAELEKISSSTELKENISSIASKHSKFVPAKEKLAEINLKNGKLDEAIKNLQDAFDASNNFEFLDKIASACISQKKPDLAISSIKKSINSKEQAFGTRYYLSSLMLSLGMLKDAEKEIEKIKAQEDLSDKQQKQLKVLESVVQKKHGNTDSAFEILLGQLDLFTNCPSISRLASISKMTNVADLSEWKDKHSGGESPSPRLSTP